MQQDWKRLFSRAGLKCLPAFDRSLGLHPNDEHDQRAMEASLGLADSESAGTPALLQTSAIMRSMQVALKENGARYLRALCWLYLADFAALNFELPLECQQGHLKSTLLAVKPSLLLQRGS